MAEEGESESVTVTAAPKGRAQARVAVRDIETGRAIPGADVEIWSVHAGTTNARGEWLSKVFAPGTYDVKVFHAGHGPIPPAGLPAREWTWIKSCTFPDSRPGTPTVVQVLLAPVIPRIVVVLTDPTDGDSAVVGAEVWVDGSKVGTTALDGVFYSKPFPPGPHAVRITKPGHGDPKDLSGAVGDLTENVALEGATEVLITRGYANRVGKIRSDQVFVTKDLHFVDWYNTEFASTNPKVHPTLTEGGSPLTLRKGNINKDKFCAFFRRCKDVYAPEITIEEFVALVTFVVTEVGGDFAPISEDGSMEYHFTAKPGVKNSYNLCNGNERAGDRLRRRGILTNAEDIAKWNTGTWPSPPPGSLLALEASKCDFYRLRGRGYIQITGRDFYGPCIFPALRESGRTDAFIENCTEAEFHDAVVNSPDVILPATGCYLNLPGKRKSFVKANDRNWRGAAGAVNGVSWYVDRFEWRAGTLYNALLPHINSKSMVLR